MTTPARLTVTVTAQHFGENDSSPCSTFCELADPISLVKGTHWDGYQQYTKRVKVTDGEVALPDPSDAVMGLLIRGDAPFELVVADGESVTITEQYMLLSTDTANPCIAAGDWAFRVTAIDETLNLTVWVYTKSAS